MANIPHEVESCCRLCGTVLAFHLDTVQPLALMNALKSRQKASNYYAILKHPVQHNGQVPVTRARGALLHHHGQYHSSHTPALHHPISQGHSLHLFLWPAGPGHRTQLLPCGLQTSFDLGGIVAEWIQHKAPLF